MTPLLASAPGYFQAARSEMLRFVPVDVSRVLEVGCGAGTFGMVLKSKRPVEVVGIEAESDVAALARSRLDRVIVGDVELRDPDVPNGYFDALVFNDVLEHLRDPWAVLSRMRPFLRVGGYVIASIPNMRYFEVMKELVVRGEWRYVDEGVMDRTHLRFFTKKSMMDMFLDTGFTHQSII
ncbi:MAG: class I SAM-dependent methyltransferase [Casimicrobiaceae bacterium]